MPISACCGDHTSNPSFASCGLVSITGLGHLQVLKTKKNFRNRDDGEEFGYNWIQKATAALT
jgi:hypothetical protein